MSDEDGYCYVAYKDCGCKVAVASERLPPRDRAKHVAAWMRDGLRVERESVKAFKAGGFGCIHKVRQESLL